MVVGNILLYICLLCTVGLIAVIMNKYEEKRKREKTKMSFKEALDLTGIPVVTFYQDNNKINFLLDTGSNLSIINESFLNNIKYTDVKAEGNIFGMEGVAKKVKYVNAEFYYKDNKFKEVFQVVNMDTAFNSVKQDTGVTINGILGSEFLKNHSYILDFKELIAYSKK